MADPIRVHLDKSWGKTMDEQILNLWVEIAKKYEVEYYLEQGKTWVAKPVDEYAAMLKQFGSGTQGVPAEFWVEKAKEELYKRTINIDLP